MNFSLFHSIIFIFFNCWKVMLGIVVCPRIKNKSVELKGNPMNIHVDIK